MSPEDVLAEFGRATSALRAAEILHNAELFADAVSRSYYAVMHAARAALLARDTIAESHSATRRLFGLELVRPGFIEKDWAGILAREQEERIAADYGVSDPWGPEGSLQLLNDAKAFVQRIREYLENVGISVPQ